MPTQSTTYNSRVTDEALEKRFRDTFRSQGGAELVDDLYAQGVIVPVVDFTAAATGQQLAQNLQTAWDFSTQRQFTTNATDTVVSTAGFWQLNSVFTLIDAGGNESSKIELTDGFAVRTILQATELGSGASADQEAIFVASLVIFVRAGDSITQTAAANQRINTSYRQIATVNGDLVNPQGFTSS